MRGGTGSTVKTDLYNLYNYVQNTLIFYPKELFIETLREFFKQDSYYRFVSDEWGYPKTVDQTGLGPEAGVLDNSTTRIYIGESPRFGPIFRPSLLIKHAGSRSVPIAMNRNEGVIQYSNTRYVDGYGNETYVVTPSHYLQSGAWEGSIVVDIEAENPRTCDELAELIALHFVNTVHDSMKNSGVFIKGINIGSPSYEDDVNNNNRKVFKNNISFEIRTEWRRQIPITSLVDAINICVEIGNTETATVETAPNLAIRTSIELLEELNSL